MWEFVYILVINKQYAALAVNAFGRNLGFLFMGNRISRLCQISVNHIFSLCLYVFFCLCNNEDSQKLVNVCLLLPHPQPHIFPAFGLARFIFMPCALRPQRLLQIHFMLQLCEQTALKRIRFNQVPEYRIGIGLTKYRITFGILVSTSFVCDFCYFVDFVCLFPLNE